jgi:hypothetical protein
MDDSPTERRLVDEAAKWSAGIHATVVTARYRRQW